MQGGTTFTGKINGGENFLTTCTMMKFRKEEGNYVRRLGKQFCLQDEVL